MSLSPGQCDVKKLSLTNHTKTKRADSASGENGVKLVEFINTIDIIESIFTSHIIADVSFNDGADFKETFDLSGAEDFEIEFLGFGSAIPLKYKLKVVQMMNLIPSNNLRAKNYTLRMASPELLIDSAHNVCKSYAAGTSTIVTDLVRKFLGSSKQLFVEDTKDPPLMIIPNMSPFKAIDFVRQRSVSSKYKSSTFLFYEDNSQYNFVTIEGILDRSSKLAKQKFFQKESVSENIKGTEASTTDKDSFRIFQNYTVKDLFNINDYFKNGALQSHVHQYDITTKAYTTKLFQNNPSNKIFYDFANAKNPDITTTLFKEYSKYQNKPFLIPFSKYKDSVNPSTNFVFDTLAERVCFSNLFTHEKTYIDIPGNTQIKAGQIIELDIPSYQSKVTNQKNNPMDSGMYLVTTVRHSVKIADSSKYDTHLELMRFGKGVYPK